MKSQIRAEIFTALDSDNSGKPPIPQENVLINEMIREYLEYNKYYNTLSVLVTESGQPVDPPFDRNFIERKLQISSSQSGSKQQLPLLYGK